jgi:hypothetical protein
LSNQQQNRAKNKTKRVLQKGIQSAKQLIQKVNIGRWIDELEHDQQVADDLERINRDNEDEEKRKELVAHVHQLCMNAIHEHLQSFLIERPDGSYEEWIAELHPDNVILDTDSNGSNDQHHTLQIDARFYVSDSDHFLLWKRHHDR